MGVQGAQGARGPMGPGPMLTYVTLRGPWAQGPRARSGEHWEPGTPDRASDANLASKPTSRPPNWDPRPPLYPEFRRESSHRSRLAWNRTLFFARFRRDTTFFFGGPLFWTRTSTRGGAQGAQGGPRGAQGGPGGPWGPWGSWARVDRKKQKKVHLTARTNAI